jgi:hypothetical protein
MDQALHIIEWRYIRGNTDMELKWYLIQELWT